MTLLTVVPAVFSRIGGRVPRKRLKAVAQFSDAARIESRMNPKTRPFKVSIEGNIGSGKSTCLKFFSKWEKVEIHPEPIEAWRNVSGHNLLGLLYTDMEKWNYHFQNYVQLSRLKIQTSPPISPQTRVKMFERSVQNSRFCFMENALKSKFLSPCEFAVLKSWYEWAEKNTDISLDLIVYLRSTPEVVWNRMLKRGRNEEASVPLDYLKQVHNSYELWLNNPEQISCPILVIDADQDIEGVVEQFEMHSLTILGHESTRNKSKAVA